MARDDQDSVVAVYDKLPEAREAISKLVDKGFTKEEISLAAHSLEDETEVHGVISHGDKTTKDAKLGGVVGGLLGLLAGTAFFWVPGFGPLVILGPLAGGLTGGVVGTLIGAMTGWGIPEEHVKRYQEAIRGGKVLVIVHGNPLRVAEADELLRTETSPEDLHLHAETSADSPEIDDSPLHSRGREDSSSS